METHKHLRRQTQGETGVVVEGRDPVFGVILDKGLQVSVTGEGLLP